MKNIPVFFLVFTVLFFSGCKSKNEKKQTFPSLIHAAGAEEQVSGYVFNDGNRNNGRDKKEKGISGVAVSNGIDIAITGPDGYYGLPVRDNNSVFVIKPTGWMTALNENNLPLFYYLHKSEGSPSGFLYQGVEPRGKLPENVNFPLYEEDTGKEFKIIVFGDTQPWDIEEVDYLAEDIIHELIGVENIAFGITMGDIVFDQLELFAPLNQAVAQVGIPWYNVMGNHDINYSAPNDELSGETFERIYGPPNYAFVYGGVHFIIIDDIIHEEKAGSHNYVGGLRADQLSFIENYLKTVPDDELIVLNMHIPLARQGNSFRQDDQEKLFELLKDFPNTLSVSAHTHMQENIFFHHDSTGWLRDEAHHHFNVGTTSGSWWNGMKGETNVPHTMMRDGTPNGYAIISFKGSEYEIDWKVAGSPDDYRMNIHIPRGIISGSDEDPLLSVNFFNGSEKTEVYYRIQGSTDWKKMKRTEMADPYYALLDQRWDGLKKLRLMEQWKNDPLLSGKDLPGTALPGAQPSGHLWTAEPGTDWPAGRHIIEIKVKDMYGRTFSAKHTMRVIAATDSLVNN